MFNFGSNYRTRQAYLENSSATVATRSLYILNVEYFLGCEMHMNILTPAVDGNYGYNSVLVVSSEDPPLINNTLAKLSCAAYSFFDSVHNILESNSHESLNLIPTHEIEVGTNKLFVSLNSQVAVGQTIPVGWTSYINIYYKGSSPAVYL